MKQQTLFVALIIFGLILSCNNSPGSNSNSPNCDYFFDTVLDKTISTSTPGKTVDLSGFKEYSVLARFEGEANATFALEFGHNQITVIRETITLNAQGWVNLAKVYPVYAPKVGCAVYHPPANTKVKIMIYAGH